MSFRQRAMVTTSSVLLVLTLQSGLAAAFFFQRERCPDVASRGHLNVLTINLLFSEIEQRHARLAAITEWVASETNGGEPVDLILLQEVAGGPISQTLNVGLDLRGLLTGKGLRYNLRYRLANGLPGLLTVGNAILSRCAMGITLSRSLPFVGEEIVDGLVVPLRRNVMMSRIKVPQIGRLSVYNTHLCAFCPPTDRLEQTKVLLDFVDDAENLFWGVNPIIMGGDFNTDLTVWEQVPVHELITMTAGFTDTYAAANSCTDCCSPGEGWDGCTFAVDGNPFAFDLFTGLAGEKQRIDYIFTWGTSISTSESVVVFKVPPFVSDHSGVLSRIQFLP
jgi:maltose 6'-phosphate phosphatase